MNAHDKEATERRMFEAHVRDKLGDDPALLYRRDQKGAMFYGEYVNENIQRYWLGWMDRAALSSPAEAGDYGFRPMLSAPQDETEIELLIYHSTRHMYAKKDRENWEQIVVGKWIDFNGGGWTWRGIAGTPVGWRAIEARKEQG